MRAARRSPRPLVAVLALVTLIGLVSQLDPVAAHADGVAEESLSLNGSPWRTTLDADLFATDRPWTPGTDRTATIRVRNRSEAAADIVVRLDRASASDSTDGYLSLQVRVGSRPFQVLPIVEASRLITLPRVRAEHSAVITVRAELLEGAPAGTEVARADGTFRVSVEETSASAAGGSKQSRGAANLYLAPIFLVVALLLLTAYTVRRRLTDRGARADPVDEGEE